MKIKLLGLIALVSWLDLFPATASPITYDISAGATLNWGPYGTESIYGSFTYDPATTKLIAMNVTLGAGFSPGTRTYSGALAYETTANSVSGGYPNMVLYFVSNLGNAPDALSTVYTNGAFSIGVTGEADPVGATPLPAALPLFATGLGALGLLGWRRKKKAAALAA
jgi:hypothetical protein